MHPKIKVLVANTNSYPYANFGFGRYRHTEKDDLGDWIWREYRAKDISNASIERFRRAQDKQIERIRHDRMGVQ